MKYAYVFTTLVTYVSAHGVITQIMGANNVVMPGLSVADGVPRDCATPNCGAEKDTSIIRDRELGTGRASALGRTPGFGPIDAEKAITNFLGPNYSGSAASTSAGNSTSTDATATKSASKSSKSGSKRGLLGNLLGGLTGGGKSGNASAGSKTAAGTVENGVSKAAGAGATSGLPTTSDDGVITMMYHQVNQDGAGPLSAAIDPTSAGKDASAFQPATVMQNVPGLGIGGLSLATTTDFMVKVQMPAGMTCSGSVGGASDVCIVRLQNQALAGPFGGSAAFTMSAGAKKRAVEYNLRKRHFARGVLPEVDEE